MDVGPTRQQPLTSLTNGLSGLDLALIIIILGLVFCQGLYVSLQDSQWMKTAAASRLFTWLPQRSVTQKPCYPRQRSKASTNSIQLDKTVDTIEEESSLSIPFSTLTSDRGGSKAFFLADQDMSFVYVGASLFASNIGSEHFVGQAGDGARRGLVTANFDWNVIVLLICLGWIFAPVYRRAGVYTTPEFLEKRFNANCRHYLTFITCIMYILTKLSASIYGGSIILSTAFGWNLYLCASACILLSLLFSVSGGLKTVMYTDLLQMIIFVVGGLLVTFIGLYHVGGLSGLKRLTKQYTDTMDHWVLFQPTSDSDFPWTGIFFGQPVMATWYWCMDQDMVQRVLSARNDNHSKGGCLLAAFLKILPPFITVIPGIIAAVLYDFRGTNVSTDNAYPVLLINMMPKGVIGLIIASIMTAMISSLDSVFNAGSSIIVNDVYKYMYPNASDKALLWVGRMATIGFAVLSFLWIPMISNGGGMFRRLMEIQAHLVPPFGIVLWLGVCWRRINGFGAFCGLLGGGFIGLIRLVLIVGIDPTSPTLPEWLQTLLSVSFQHVAIILWMVSGTICIVGSFLTDPPTDEIDNYVVHWNELFIQKSTQITRNNRRMSFILASLAVIALGCLCTLWVLFSL